MQKKIEINWATKINETLLLDLMDRNIKVDSSIKLFVNYKILYKLFDYLRQQGRSPDIFFSNFEKSLNCPLKEPLAENEIFIEDKLSKQKRKDFITISEKIKNM